MSGRAFTGPRHVDHSARRISPSALMAVGTAVSRVSGFVRSALLVAVLGAKGPHVDIFNTANTIPNALYILLAGGVFNAVLVPQLVRTMRDDADGGEAYAQRIVTLAAVFLAAVSAVLVLAAPLIMRIYLSSSYSPAERASAIDFARWCLPQVFFYGMFVLVGQILNARHSFGPMMWAPIMNNVVSVAVLALYVGAYGEAGEHATSYTSPQEVLLGLGSTLGIAVQFLVLLPYLRAAGFRYRPRFDFRGTGLGRTARLGVWTVLFVIVNQVAYVVVVKLASSGGAAGYTGYTAYTFAFSVVMVPHAIITVSLATAALPSLSRRAAEGDLVGVARSLTTTLRQALAIMVPFAALMPLVAADAARVLLHGAAARSVSAYTPILALFAPGVLLFTFHYLMLRGFYALEQNRTVFFNQVWVAAANVVAALALVHAASPSHRALALVGAYIVSYAVGGTLSAVTLRRRLPALQVARTIRFLVRLVLATLIAGGLGWGLTTLLHRVQADPAWPVALVFAALVTALFGVVFVLLARAMHVREVTSVLSSLTRRVAGGR